MHFCEPRVGDLDERHRVRRAVRDGTLSRTIEAPKPRSQYTSGGSTIAVPDGPAVMAPASTSQPARTVPSSGDRRCVSTSMHVSKKPNARDMSSSTWPSAALSWRADATRARGQLRRSRASPWPTPYHRRRQMRLQHVHWRAEDRTPAAGHQSQARQAADAKPERLHPLPERMIATGHPRAPSASRHHELLARLEPAPGSRGRRPLPHRRACAPIPPVPAPVPGSALAGMRPPRAGWPRAARPRASSRCRRVSRTLPGHPGVVLPADAIAVDRLRRSRSPGLGGRREPRVRPARRCRAPSWRAAAALPSGCRGRAA